MDMGRPWPPPPGCLVGLLEILCLCLAWRASHPRSGCVSTCALRQHYGRPFPSKIGPLSSREPQGLPGCHVLCLMDLVPTATASRGFNQRRVGFTFQLLVMARLTDRDRNLLAGPERA